MKNLFFLVPLVLILITLYPSLNLPLIDDSHEHLSVMHGEQFFGKDVNFLHPPPVFYLKHYGIQFASLAVAYKLFDFNSKMYFIWVLVLKILAAFSIFYFVSKLTRSTIAGIISTLFFGVCTATVQNIIRVSLFQIYISIIFLCLFLDRWFIFHHHPNKKNLILSITFFLITILSHPIRMVGIVFLVIGGETYWLFESGFDKLIKIRIGHLLLLIFCIYVLIFVIGSISSTEELTAKIISPQILLTSLFTGFPPVITSLFLFIANLIISPFTFTYGYLSLSVVKDIVIFLPLLGLLFLTVCLRKRKFLLAFISIPAIVFPYLIHFSTPYLTDWRPEWVIVTQLGGTIFILLNLIILFFWDRNKPLAEVGLLGSAIVLSNLLLPWMITPQASLLDQSPFLFIHRYYTVSSIGLGMLLASVFVLSLQSLKPKLNVSIVTLFIPATIIFLIYLQAITTNWHLVKENQGINTEKIDLFWTKFKPYSKNFVQKQNIFYIYIEHDGSLNEDYITRVFPRRVEIELSQIANPPKINFIFTKEKIYELLKNHPNEDYRKNFFYAFKFDGKDLYDIKSKLNNILY